MCYNIITLLESRRILCLIFPMQDSRKSCVMNKIITDGLGNFSQAQKDCLQAFRDKGVDVVVAV